MKQTFKATSGSFFNLLMSNNESIPVAGEWATIMSYTDRNVMLVREVSADGKEVVLEYCNTEARVKPSPMGHQDWVHTPNGHTCKVRYYRGKWRKVGSEIVFTDEFLEFLFVCARFFAWADNQHIFANTPISCIK